MVLIASMFLIKAKFLVLILFILQTNEIPLERWWVPYLPQTHLKFYEPLIQRVGNNKLPLVTTKTINVTAIIPTPTKATTSPSGKITTNAPTNRNNNNNAKAKKENLPTRRSQLLTPKTSTTTTIPMGSIIRTTNKIRLMDAQDISKNPAILNTTIESSTTALRPVNNYFFNIYMGDKAANETTTEVSAGTTKDNSNLIYDIQPDCGNVNETGVYLIRAELFGKRPFMARCQIFDVGEPAWLVIQLRDDEDPTTDFNRNWAEYREGFGKISGSYWLGLEKIWAITHSTLHELIIAMVDFNNIYRWHRYETFSVASEEQNYTLNLYGVRYGAGGDSLKNAEGQKFSTYDSDNDLGCAKKMRAGWWYKDCEYGNLNSPYSQQITADHDGVMWPTFHVSQPLSYAVMMIRARKYKPK